MKSIQVVQRIGLDPIYFFDSSFRSFKSIPKDILNISIINNGSVIRLMLFLIKNRKRFLYILGAEVDALNFQILLRFLKIKYFYSLDEGVFSVQPSSIYNSMSEFAFKGQKRYLLLNSLFGFPWPPKILMQKSDKHFTWYRRESFSEIPHLYNKIVEMEPKTYSKRIKKVFISQPWNFMGLSEDALKNLASLLVKHNIDTYISHPRENMSFFADKYLHLINLLVIDLNHPVEEFINFLSELSKDIEVYTFASGACLELHENVPINLFNILNPDQTHQSQESLKKILNSRQIDFNIYNN
jgi:hypothetical protein